MLKVFPIYRVILPNLVGDREYFCFTNKDDADWFSSHFEDSSVDVISQISMVECISDDEKDSFLNLIRYGTGTFDK